MVSLEDFDTIIDNFGLITVTVVHILKHFPFNLELSPEHLQEIYICDREFSVTSFARRIISGRAENTAIHRFLILFYFFSRMQRFTDGSDSSEFSTSAS